MVTSFPEERVSFVCRVSGLLRGGGTGIAACGLSRIADVRAGSPRVAAGGPHGQPLLPRSSRPHVCELETCIRVPTAGKSGEGAAVMHAVTSLCPHFRGAYVSIEEATDRGA